MAEGSRETLSTNARTEFKTALSWVKRLGRIDRHRVEVVVQLGLGQQFLQASVGVQAAAAVAQLAGQELEVGGEDVDSPEGLADVGGRLAVDRRAQVFEERVDQGEVGVEPGRRRRESLDARP